jgi:hypothetical protein
MLAAMTEAKRALAWGCCLMWLFLGYVLATTKTHPPVRTLTTAVSPHSITTNVLQVEFNNYRQMYGEMPEETLNRSVAYRVK